MNRNEKFYFIGICVLILKIKKKYSLISPVFVNFVEKNNNRSRKILMNFKHMSK